MRFPVRYNPDPEGGTMRFRLATGFSVAFCLLVVSVSACATSPDTRGEAPAWIDADGVDQDGERVQAVARATVRDGNVPDAEGEAGDRAKAALVSYVRASVAVREERFARQRIEDREVERVHEHALDVLLDAEIEIPGLHCRERWHDEAAATVYVRCLVAKRDLRRRLQDDLSGVRSALADAVRADRAGHVVAAIGAWRTADAEVNRHRDAVALTLAFLGDDVRRLLGASWEGVAVPRMRWTQLVTSLGRDAEIRRLDAGGELQGSAGGALKPISIAVYWKGRAVRDLVPEVDAAPGTRIAVAAASATETTIEVPYLGRPQAGRSGAELVLRLPEKLDRNRPELGRIVYAVEAPPREIFVSMAGAAPDELRRRLGSMAEEAVAVTAGLRFGADAATHVIELATTPGETRSMYPDVQVPVRFHVRLREVNGATLHEVNVSGRGVGRTEAAALADAARRAETQLAGALRDVAATVP